jgi:hypothetical protein
VVAEAQLAEAVGAQQRTRPAFDSAQVCHWRVRPDPSTAAVACLPWGAPSGGGVLAPHSQWRSPIVPSPPPSATAAPTASTDAAEPGCHSLPPKDDESAKPPTHRCRYRPWHELMRRCLKIDVETCGRCGGKMSLVALVKDPGRLRFASCSVAPPPRSAPDPKLPSALATAHRAFVSTTHTSSFVARVVDALGSE